MWSYRNCIKKCLLRGSSGSDIKMNRNQKLFNSNVKKTEICLILIWFTDYWSIFTKIKWARADKSAESDSIWHSEFIQLVRLIEIIFRHRCQLKRFDVLFVNSWSVSINLPKRSLGAIFRFDNQNVMHSCTSTSSSWTKIKHLTLQCAECGHMIHIDYVSNARPCKIDQKRNETIAINFVMSSGNHQAQSQCNRCGISIRHFIFFLYWTSFPCFYRLLRQYKLECSSTEVNLQNFFYCFFLLPSQFSQHAHLLARNIGSFN